MELVKQRTHGQAEQEDIRKKPAHVNMLVDLSQLESG